MSTPQGRFHTISFKSFSLYLLGLLITALLAFPSDSFGRKVVFDDSVGVPHDSRILIVGSGGHSIDPVVQNGRNPDWSPNGLRIVYQQVGFRWIVDHDQQAAEPVDMRGISTIRENGSGKRDITKNPSDTDPAWSPDGSKVAFARGNRLYQISVDEETGDKTEDLPTLLYELDDDYRFANPAWSLDGTKIAFERRQDTRRDAEGIHHGYSTISVVALRRHRGRLHVDLERTGIRVQREDRRIGFNSNPAWSPGGGSIVFSHGMESEEEQRQDLYVHNLNLRSTEPYLRDRNTVDGSPSWLDDGSGIVFSRSQINDGADAPKNLFYREYVAEQQHWFTTPLTETDQTFDNPNWWPKAPLGQVRPDPDGDGDDPDPEPPGGGDGNGGDGENRDNPCDSFSSAEARRICREIFDRQNDGGGASNPNSPPGFSSPQSPGTRLAPIDKNSLKDSGLLPKTDDSLKSKVQILKGAKYQRKGKKRDYVKVRVRCYALPGKRCKGTLRLYSTKRYRVAKGKKKRLLVGLKKFSIAPKLATKGKNKSESETEYVSPKKSKTKTKHTSEKVVNKPQTITVRLRAASSKKIGVAARRITSKVIKTTVRALKKRNKSKRLKATATVTTKDVVGVESSTKANKTLKVKPPKKKSRKKK